MTIHTAAMSMMFEVARAALLAMAQLAATEPTRQAEVVLVEAMQSLQSICWTDASGARRVSVNQREDDYTFTWASADCEVEIRVRGAVRFTRDFVDVASIAEGGSVRLTEGGETRRRLEIRPGSYGLEYEHAMDGRAQPFDAVTRGWLRAMLLHFFRASGYAAEQRTAWILQDLGLAGLVQEIDALRGDHARRRYYQAALASGRLSESEVTDLLERAARQISNDYELAELLIGASRLDLSNPVLQRAYLLAVSGLRSDFEHRRVLSGMVTRERLAPHALLLVLVSAQEIDSDYELAELLLQVVRTQPLTLPQRASFMQALDTIESSHEHGRVSSALLRAEQRG